MTTDQPTSDSSTNRSNIFFRFGDSIRGFQLGPPPSQISPIFLLVYMPLLLALLYFGIRINSASVMGDHELEVRLKSVFGLLMSVFITIQMTLTFLHPTRRWLSVVFAAILTLNLIGLGHYILTH
jgi:hypothetical protein